MKEKLVEKIQKLLAKQESANEVGNLEEANAFALKVSELLLKHNLSMFDIKDTKRKNDVTHSIHKDITAKKNEGSFIFGLYHTICQFNFCKIIILSRSDGEYAMLIGTPSDVEVVRFIGDQLNSKFRFAAKKAFATNKVYGIKKGKFIRDFLKGAVSGLYFKYYEMRKNAVGDNPNINALVLSRDGQIEQVKKEIFQDKELVTNKQRKVDDNIASNLGFKTGKEVDINKGLENSEEMEELLDKNREKNREKMLQNS